MSSAAFTCISCRVAFVEADVQRAHYKSDWHRYNLKRKVAALPPVTAEDFQTRVLEQRALVEEESKDKSGHCQICNKHFGSKNSYENHLNSKRHKEQEAKSNYRKVVEASKASAGDAEKEVTIEKVKDKNAANTAIKEALMGPAARPKVTVEDAQDEEMASDDSDTESWGGDALGLEECLFCSHVSRDLETNISHMSRAHSFFLPDPEYIADLEGLVTYLGEKVGEGRVCLWCNERSRDFLTTRAVQQHMVDKAHCRLLFEGDAVFEYSDFYDYRASYPDYEAVAAVAMDTAEEGDEEEEVAPEVVDGDSYTMVLPSGATVGHRSLQRFFRQNVTHYRARSGQAGLTPVSKVMSQYRALGWTGNTGAVAERKVVAKDMAFVQRMKHRRSMALGCKANKLQTHFRPQVIF